MKNNLMRISIFIYIILFDCTQCLSMNRLFDEMNKQESSMQPYVRLNLFYQSTHNPEVFCSCTGSGVLLENNYILTCGHVLYRRRDRPYNEEHLLNFSAKVHYVVVQIGTKTIKSKKFLIPESWENEHISYDIAKNFDIGLIYLGNVYGIHIIKKNIYNLSPHNDHNILKYRHIFVCGYYDVTKNEYNEIINNINEKRQEYKNNEEENIRPYYSIQTLDMNMVPVDLFSTMNRHAKEASQKISQLFSKKNNRHTDQSIYILFHQAFCFYEPYGIFSDFFNFIRYKATTHQGMSGGPVITQFENNSSIVGVHVCSFSNESGTKTGWSGAISMNNNIQQTMGEMLDQELSRLFFSNPDIPKNNIDISTFNQKPIVLIVQGRRNDYIEQIIENLELKKSLYFHISCIICSDHMGMHIHDDFLNNFFSSKQLYLFKKGLIIDESEWENDNFYETMSPVERTYMPSVSFLQNTIEEPSFFIILGMSDNILENIEEFIVYTHEEQHSYWFVEHNKGVITDDTVKDKIYHTYLT